MDQKTKVLEALAAAYEAAQGSFLGLAILETVAAACVNGQISARIGFNDDGSQNLFCANKELCDLMGASIRDKHVRLSYVPPMSPSDFCKVLRTPGLIETLTQPQTPGSPADAYDDRTPQGWSPSRARQVVEQLAWETQGMQSTMLNAALEEIDAASTEARFRVLLNEALGWKADKLDLAVALVQGDGAICDECAALLPGPPTLRAVD